MKTNSQHGFTVIELLVVVSIMAVLTAVVSVNFRNVRASQEISSVRYDLISRIREIQGYLLSGKLESSQPVWAYYLTFDGNLDTYRVEYEASNGAGAGTGVRILIEDLKYASFGQKVAMTDRLLDGAPVPQNTPVVVELSAPFGKILIQGAESRVLLLEFTHDPSGLQKTLIIDGVSGRVE